jgi:hypothetical protein
MDPPLGDVAPTSRVEGSARPRAGTSAIREGEYAMSGTITAIDRRTGILSVRTDTGEHIFHFPPPLIKGLKGGDLITVHVAVEH